MAIKRKRRKDSQELHHQGKNGQFLAFVRRRMCKFTPKHDERRRHQLRWDVRLSSEAYGTRDRPDLVQPQQAIKCSPSHAGFDDIDPGLQDLQEPCLEPKHKMFLSHSGAQKNFTEQLCKDLERIHHFPFFDKRPDSLGKGEKFAPLIIEAAKQCHVAVLVLSEEFFTRSKWPMIELNQFVQAQASTNTHLKILPLFFGLSLEQFKDAKQEGRRANWLKVWQGWASEDDRIDVKKWMRSLSKVPGQNGIEYDEAGGEVTYREKVVAAICKLVPPDVKWDVSHVQALPQLCEPILRQMDKTTPQHKYGVRIVGLFGMGGVGKSTISKVLCNQLFGDFCGRVCHVELGGKNLMELRKKALKELTGASPEILTVDDDQLVSLLESRMQRQKVFLSLDNVFDDQIDEARMYLKVRYHQESIVLVTARSIDILKSLRIKKRDCMEMPELKKEDATNLFLYHAAPHENLNNNDWEIIKECVDKCRFAKGDTYHYLPLALKVWGSQLGSISPDPSKWVKSLKILNDHKFNPLRVLNHPVFSLLRQGYDMLRQEERHIFLDLALFVSPLGSHYMFSVWDWLSIIHKKSRDIIENSLGVLKRRALLDEVNEDSMEFKIHDMYLDFAREEVREGPFDARRILYSLKESDVPPELLKYPSGSCWPRLERLAIHESEAQSLKRAKLYFCRNVDVLQLFDCEQLAEVNVKRMRCLISLDVLGCNELGEKFEGVEKLRNLVWFRWMNIWQPAPFLQNMSLLTTLQVLDLRGDDSNSSVKLPPNLTGCVNLRELTLSSHGKLTSFPDLSKLSKLEKIDFSLCPMALGFPDLSNLRSLRSINFSSCEAATSMIGLSSLTNLRYLNLGDCPLVEDLPGLGDLIALQKLNIELTGISELPDLRKLQDLRDLSVHDCEKLTSLIGLEHVTSIRCLYAHDCGILSELPNFSQWKELETFDLSCTGIDKLPIDFERLARHRILKLQGCYNLFEPFVNLLKVQQQRVSKNLHACIANGSSSNKQTMDQLGDNMRKDIVYHLNKCFERRLWLFDVEKILKGERIAKELEAGIEFLIKEICEHEDMGILSFLIAKYAATGGCWMKLTANPTLQPLAQRIVQFLDKRLESTMRDEAISKNDIGYACMNDSTYLEVRCIHLILGILILKNEVMAQALVGDGACTLIIRCLKALEDDKFIIERIGSENYQDFMITFEAWLKRLK